MSDMMAGIWPAKPGRANASLEPIEPTGRQERAVLQILKWANICGTRTVFGNPRENPVMVRRLAARINDLRKKGWNIETVKWCDQHEHPESKQIMYRLVK